MKLADLRELACWMTPYRWFARGRLISLRPDNTGMGATMHTQHIGNFAERADSEACAALRNHAEALLDLVFAVDAVLTMSDPGTESPVVRELRAARGRLEDVA